ncbi:MULTISPECIES: sigma-70 family RNA polymerase sigma factor [Streptomyces]|uniref:sigma-70 family RNA polymerase sigma factor n=1 Tax=unclassified Streptomyces TaxID=2593676 RepID=UPI0022AC3E9B|nr:sigma-70 family RNA polymerase sigma factor [Streptomyces aurantiacus]WAU82635.1 sigma-70 family RNA polymerase sigma factor [Streptomyces aurantiacus]
MEHDSDGDRGQQAGVTDFEEFYQSAYARLVGQLFSVTGSLEQAEDVVQEAFIRALDRWPRIQAYDVPELWVRRVAINLAVSEIRRLRRRAAALLRLGAQRPLPHLTPQTVEVAEMLRHVPVNQRPVLLLHDVLDLPIEQVAEQLGLPVSTVRGRLARARANLARRFAADPEGALSHHGRP